MQRDKAGDKDSGSPERRNIAAELEEFDHPVNFSSVDGKVRYTAPRVNFGLRLFNDYKHYHNPIKLNQSCSQGLHDALIERTELNFKLITDDKIPDHKKSAAKQTLLADLEMLSLHYWSVGSYHACRILLDIGNYYAMKKPNKNEENPYATEAITYQELAASYFFRTKLLAKEDTSKYLAKMLHDIGDMDAALAEYQSWGKEKLLAKIDEKRQLKLESDESKFIHGLIYKK